MNKFRRSVSIILVHLIMFDPLSRMWIQDGFAQDKFDIAQMKSNLDNGTLQVPLLFWKWKKLGSSRRAPLLKILKHFVENKLRQEKMTLRGVMDEWIGRDEVWNNLQEDERQLLIELVSFFDEAFIRLEQVGNEGENAAKLTLLTVEKFAGKNSGLAKITREFFHKQSKRSAQASGMKAGNDRGMSIKNMSAKVKDSLQIPEDQQTIYDALNRKSISFTISNGVISFAECEELQALEKTMEISKNIRNLFYTNLKFKIRKRLPSMKLKDFNGEFKLFFGDVETSSTDKEKEAYRTLFGNHKKDGQFFCNLRALLNIATPFHRRILFQIGISHEAVHEFLSQAEQGDAHIEQLESGLSLEDAKLIVNSVRDPLLFLENLELVVQGRLIQDIELLSTLANASDLGFDEMLSRYRHLWDQISKFNLRDLRAFAFSDLSREHELREKIWGGALKNEYLRYINDIENEHRKKAQDLYDGQLHDFLEPPLTGVIPLPFYDALQEEVHLDDWIRVIKKTESKWAILSGKMPLEWIRKAWAHFEDSPEIQFWILIGALSNAGRGEKDLWDKIGSKKYFAFINRHYQDEMVRDAFKAVHPEIQEKVMKEFSQGKFKPSSLWHIEVGFLNLLKILQEKHLRLISFDSYFDMVSKYRRDEQEESFLSNSKELAELYYLAWEAYEMKKRLMDPVLKKAKRLGKNVVVVENLSYGEMALAPIKKILTDEGVLIWSTKVGSTICHDHPDFTDPDLFTREQREYLVREEPIVIVIDGSYSLDPEKRARLNRKFPRYPDARQGYANYFALLSIALNPKANIMKLFGLKYPLGRVNGNNQGAYAKTQKQLRKTFEEVENRGHESYQMYYWYGGKLPLKISEERKERDLPAQCDLTKVADISDAIQGPTLIFVESSIEDIVPERVRSLAGGIAHHAAYYDDKKHFEKYQFLITRFGPQLNSRYRDFSRMAYQSVSSVLEGSSTQRVVGSRYDVMMLDLDGTLADVRKPITQDVALVLIQTLAKGVQIGILTAQSIREVKTNLLKPLIEAMKGDVHLFASLENLHLFTSEGAFGYGVGRDGTPVAQYYAKDFQDKNEVHTVRSILNEALTYDREIEVVDRGPVIMLHNVRQYRDRFKIFIEGKLQQYGLSMVVLKRGKHTLEVRLMDISKKLAADWMMARFGPDPSRVLVVSDSLNEGGPDLSMIIHGARNVQVGSKPPQDQSVEHAAMRGWLGTLQILQEAVYPSAVEHEKHEVPIDEIKRQKARNFLDQFREEDVTELLIKAARMISDQTDDQIAFMDGMILIMIRDQWLDAVAQELAERLRAKETQDGISRKNKIEAVQNAAKVLAEKIRINSVAFGRLIEQAA